MSFLKDLFGKKEKPVKPYVENGFKLTYKLAINLNLDGWKGEITYSKEETAAIDLAWAKQKEEFGDVKFHPEIADEVFDQLRREAVASGLQEVADDETALGGYDTLPADWKRRVSSYLKAFAASLSPRPMGRVAELLTLAGYKTEAKEAWQVVALYPSYCATVPGMEGTKLHIVDKAEQKLRELG